MAELVDAPDLKSVGQYARAGSIPAIRTISFISRLCSGQSLVATAIPSPLQWGGGRPPERRLALGASKYFWFELSPIYGTIFNLRSEKDLDKAEVCPISRTMLPLILPPSLRSLCNLELSGK